MSFDISFQPMRVLTDGADSEGMLILVGGQLAAVMVRLDGDVYHPQDRGGWLLEAGFGKCRAQDAPLFRTPQEAGAWVGATLEWTVRPGEAVPGHGTAPGWD